MSVLHRTFSKPTLPAASSAPDGSIGPLAAPRTSEAPTEPDHLSETSPARSELDRHGRVRRTRAGGAWIAVLAGAAVLTFLLVFVVQNSHAVTIHFLGLSGSVSLAVALLLAAVAGVLLVAILGSTRIVQLRRSVKRRARPR